MSITLVQKNKSKGILTWYARVPDPKEKSKTQFIDESLRKICFIAIFDVFAADVQIFYVRLLSCVFTHFHLILEKFKNIQN